MKTETKFPVVFGTLVKVACDTGYELKGSNTIVCDKNTTFTLMEQPACIQLGEFFQTLRLSAAVSLKTQLRLIQSFSCCLSSNSG